MNLRDIPHIHSGSAHFANRHVVDGIHCLRTAVQPDTVLAVAHFGGTGGQDQILSVERIAHVSRGNSFGEQRLWIEIHHNLPGLAAHWQQNGRALHRSQLRPDEVCAVIVQLLLRQPLSANGQLQDGNAGSVIPDDKRRGHVRRHDAQNRLRRRSDLRHARFYTRVRVEKHLDHGYAGERLRFNVLDIVDSSGVGALGNGGDSLLHLLRRESGIGKDRADHRDVDFRKNIGRHAINRDDAQDGDEQSHHNEGIGAPES